MSSILTSIKKLLGITEEYEHFDQDLIMHINSVLGILTQLGVGPAEGFVITGKDETWNQLLTDGPKLEMVKSYIFQKVKLLFDPPQSSSLLDAIHNSIKEFEWRMNVEAEQSEKESG